MLAATGEYQRHEKKVQTVQIESAETASTGPIDAGIGYKRFERMASPDAEQGKYCDDTQTRYGEKVGFMVRKIREAHRRSLRKRER